MKFFKVQSEEMAQELSTLIYSLMFPDGQISETKYLFEWAPYLNGWVICISENYHCPVFQKPEFQTTIDKLSAIIGFALADGEGSALVQKLMSGSIILEEIIPSGLEEVSEQDFIASLPVIKPF